MEIYKRKCCPGGSGWGLGGFFGNVTRLCILNLCMYIVHVQALGMAVQVEVNTKYKHDMNEMRVVGITTRNMIGPCTCT